MLLTLEQIIALPDALGRHACECGHPEMSRLMAFSTAPHAARRCFLSGLNLSLEATSSSEAGWPSLVRMGCSLR